MSATATELAASSPSCWRRVTGCLPRWRIWRPGWTGGLADQGFPVGQRSQVAQLVPADDRADGVHLAVGDIECDDGDQSAVGVEEERAGLTVDLRRAYHRPGRAGLPPKADEQSADAVAAGDRAPPRTPHAAAVTVDRDISRQHRDQAVQVAVADRREEPAGEFLALAARCLIPRALLADMLPGAARELTAVVLRPAHDPGRLVVSVAEDVVQQEY